MVGCVMKMEAYGHLRACTGNGSFRPFASLYRKWKFRAICEPVRGQLGEFVPLLQAFSKCREPTAGFQVCFIDEERMEIKNQAFDGANRMDRSWFAVSTRCLPLKLLRLQTFGLSVVGRLKYLKFSVKLFHPFQL
jgi:hypothetical protein